MKELFSLGELYPSDFLKEGELPKSEKVELKLIMDEEGLVRLEKTAPINQMYGKYWYRSGLNSTMRAALKDVVDSILKIKDLGENDVWLDIACNDGTLLSFVPAEINRICIDPADDTYKEESEEHSNLTIQDYFTAEVFKSKLGKLKCSVVTSIAMFYDVPDPKQFIKDVYEILEEDGIWVMQLSYSPLMITQMAFDNICHEHIYYYSLSDLNNLLRANNFFIDDCELNESNGGSIRLYIKKTDSHKSNYGTKSFRVDSLIEYEKTLLVNNITIWKGFGVLIKMLKEQTVSFIKEEKEKGKSIWAYGASTKGNTLLQYFGLDNTLIDGIADKNESKHGLYTVGSNIKIYSEEAMRLMQPDYLLVLPWHFKKEFIDREKAYLLNGGRMIFPCPTFEII